MRASRAWAWGRGWVYYIYVWHPRPQAQAREALTVALVQAVELRWISDAEAWSLSICTAP